MVMQALNLDLLVVATQLEYEGKDVSQVVSGSGTACLLQKQVLESNVVQEAIAQQKQMDEIVSESRRDGSKRAQMRRTGDSVFVSSLNSGNNRDQYRDLSQRRNRPGQRARRAAAERKFGEKCKHLQQEKESSSSLHPSWAAKIKQKELQMSGPSCVKIKF
jgi:hypothetical protein